MEELGLHPIPFNEFVTTYGGDESIAADLPKNFFESPSAQYRPDSPYLSKRYSDEVEQQRLVGAIANLGLKVLSSLLKPGLKEEHIQLTEMLGFDHEECPKHRARLYVQAAIFRFLGCGSSAFRASFAAIELRRIFPDPELTVWIASRVPEDDSNEAHFQVDLSRRGKAFTYDPLINPESVFPRRMYGDKVLKCFSYPLEDKFGESWSLVVDKAMADGFEKRWPTMQRTMWELVKSKMPTTHELWGDNDCRKALERNGFPLKDLTHEDCENVLGIFQERVAHHAPEPTLVEAFFEFVCGVDPDGDTEPGHW